MDDTWQLKCSSALQSSASQEVELSSWQRFLYPTFVGQELRSQLQGRMSNDSVISVAPGCSSYSVGHSEVGNSFQALLSGPASLLHGDFQEFSNLRPSNSWYKLPGEFGGICASKTAGSRVPNVGHQSLQNGLNFCASKVSNGLSSGLQHGLPAASINLQRSGMAMVDILPVVSANDRIKEYTLPRGECCNMISVSNVKIQNVNMPLPQKMSLEAEVPKQSSPLSGCPRVFCLGISGDLLLSNTGLLGILCSCHYFHMSVSKFCEHSGLRNVNAGDAVHMDSGETIAQWRKLYFQKFGIRVPEDQSGWDWPEGLSLTANLVKFGASIPVSASNISRKPDLNHDIEPSEVSERPVDNFLPGNPVSNQNSGVPLHNSGEYNRQYSGKFLVKEFPGNLQRNLCGERNNKLVPSPSFACSPMPKFSVQGPQIGSQFLSGNIHGNTKTGTVPTSYPSPQNLTIPVKSSDVCETIKAKDSIVLDKDTSASNIELRLGQPYHLSVSSGNPILSSIGPWVQSKLVDPQKPFSADQRTHKLATFKQEEVRQDFPQFAGLFDSSAKSKEHLEQHFLHRNCSIKLAMDSADKEKADMSKNPMVSLRKQFNTSPDGYSNVTNINQQVLPEALHYASHIVKGNSFDIAQNATNSLERHHDLIFLGSVDKGKSVRCNSSSICPEPVSLSELHNCRENPSSFTGFASRNSHSEFPFMHNNGWLHFSNVQKAPDPGKFSHCKEKVPCVESSGLSHPVVFKSTASTTASQILPPQPVRTVLSSPCAELTPALFEQESICSSPYLLDDNLRLIALRQILELSKQQQVMSCSGKNLEQWRCGSSSDADLIDAVVESSKSGEQRLVSKVTHKEDPLEFSARSIQAYPFSRKASNDLNQCLSVSGLDNCCDLSTWSQGMPYNRKENILQHQLPHDPLTFKQPSLIIGRNGKGIVSANEHGSCFHGAFYIQGTCGCITHAKCLGDQCHLRNDSSPNPIREPIGSICGEAPSLIASQLVKDCTVLKKTTRSDDQCRKLNNGIGKGISYHASKWKDVPSKVKRTCDTNNSTVVLSERRDELPQLRDTAAKGSNGLVKVAELLGEKEMSNVSSGCSAPAVTQASIVSKNIEVSTVLAGNTVCINNNLGDEGSGIDKCGSSDNAYESDQSDGFYGSTCKTSLKANRSLEVSNNQPCRTLLDEVKRMNSLTWRKGQHQFHNCAGDGTADGKTGFSEEPEKGLKAGKRKRQLELRTVDALLSKEGPISCDNTAERPCLSKDEHTPKRVKFKSSSVKPLPRKRDLLRLYRETDKEDAPKSEINDASVPNQTPGISSRKKFRSTVISDTCTQFQAQQKVKITGEDNVNYSSMDYTKTDCHQVNLCCRKARPVVCGNFGEITNGKPANIVSLDKVLKNAKRCTLLKKSKSRSSIWREGKRTNFKWSDACFDKFSNVKKTKENCDNEASGSDDMTICTSVKERTKESSGVDKLFGDESLLLLNQIDVVGKDNAHAQSKPKIKEIRKRSLFELTLKGKNSESLWDKKIVNNTAEREFEKSFKIKEAVGRSCKNDAKRCDQDKRHQSVKNSFSFCCVCGSSNEDESNCLLECGRCLIKIHQACYGVPKVPKGLWYCRPCRTNSADIACVLCGYGGGAMTRALRSQTIVKGLLKAWSLEEESWPKKSAFCPDTLHDKFDMLHSSGSGLKNNAYPVPNSVVDPSSAAVWDVKSQNKMDTLQISLSAISNLKVHNSITAGVHDSTVKQWVHMVCGLWTPRTRCPNVDTMSAFDVSDASCPRASVVCSICNRPGGTCIQCRVINCSVQFHPWCAHQKGLLQSEVEGVDNEHVGFYGRCVLHATYPINNTSSDATCTGKEYSRQGEESCARTEGYKGRKRDGFWHNLNDQSKGQCLVLQEQLNAWNHINGIGQKSCIQGLPKLPPSDMDYDCRKEYNRYKQAKGWKRLVVYKSGIHALGLYTSQFISRGEMVVEYVGEIVGIRVADKREIEYQSGRKLQYKSACYFFRIDTEHIIDATCKGGIARFVNHSCLPNCVAKVISVRNEKKVVFFADRDIYPGEEITYDYHFNHEDEGKKIPCFCNSKNCRRYLN